MYRPRNRGVPHVQVNFVTSLDGAVAAGGLSTDLSDADDQRIFHLLRMMADVVLVGAGTLRTEGYDPLRVAPTLREWRQAHGLTDHPRLAVVSRQLSGLATHAAITSAPTRPIIITHNRSPQDLRVDLSRFADVLVCGEDVVDVGLMLSEFHARHMTQILCEGGPELFGHLVAADRVDELCLSVSPLLVGPGPTRIIAGPQMVTARRLVLRHVLTGQDGSTFLRYTKPDLGEDALDSEDYVLSS